MPSTYTPISTTTLTSTQATVTLSNIPATYTDILVVVNNLPSASNLGAYMRINSDTGANYSFTLLDGWAGSNGTFRSTSASFAQLGFWQVGSNNEPYTVIIHMNNYANTNIRKTFLTRVANSAELSAAVGSWRSTAAITSLTFSAAQNFSSNSFAAGTMFSIYGIRAA